jgi:hypothetical protein
MDVTILTSDPSTVEAGEIAAILHNELNTYVRSVTVKDRAGVLADEVWEADE